MRAAMSNACTPSVLDVVGLLVVVKTSNAKDDRRFVTCSTEGDEKSEGGRDPLMIRPWTAVSARP